MKRVNVPVTVEARFYSDVKDQLKAGDFLSMPAVRQSAETPMTADNLKFKQAINALNAVDKNEIGVKKKIVLSAVDDVKNLIGNIPVDVDWVIYNMERGMTPSIDLADPVASVKQFADVVHASGRKMGFAPLRSYIDNNQGTTRMSDIVNSVDAIGYQGQLLLPTMSEEEFIKIVKEKYSYVKGINPNTQFSLQLWLGRQTPDQMARVFNRSVKYIDNAVIGTHSDLEGVKQVLSQLKWRNVTSCLSRPVCLDVAPKCLIPEPAEGWCPSTPIAPTKVLVQPAGLAAVNTFEDVQRTGKPFADATYQNPYIKGVSFRTSWQDLEPIKGHYDFKKLDEVFAKAASQSKWVDLILIPGFGTPAWALQGVQTAQFNVKYGLGQGEKLTLPLPWDETYLNRWFTFLEEINKRYGHRPEFRMISAAGPTSVSSEMSLPNTTEDLLTWQQMGYTPEKYVAAWKKTFAAYAKIFPKQHFSLALYPGLPLPDKSYRDSVRNSILLLGVNGYPRQFALQTSGLNPLKDEAEGAGYLLVKQYSNQVLAGFMMSTAFTNKQDKYGDPATALEASIDRGLSAGAKYLEIYEDDILNPNLQNILQTASQKMSSNDEVKTKPSVDCLPRPACLDAAPKCLIPEPVGGWCPSSSSACTEEAKKCPDGSYVVRTGPNCEFAPCLSQ